MAFEKIKSGKVRDIYDLNDGRLLLVATNRISAFDVVLPDQIPYKGTVLNHLSAHWFDLTNQIIPNHKITVNPAYLTPALMAEGIDPDLENFMFVKKLNMIPIECIVRGYITGSGWDSYQKTGKVCGIQLPPGLKESEQLPEPIYTPTTKAEVGHDEPITYEDTVELVGEDLAKQLRDKSIEIYLKCADYAIQKGVIIADTKLEFGIDEEGTLYLADELVTPDSSRFWSVEDYEVGMKPSSYDKQLVRDWLENSGWDKKMPAPYLPSEIISETSRKYVEILEKLTDESIYVD